MTSKSRSEKAGMAKTISELRKENARLKRRIERLEAEIDEIIADAEGNEEEEEDGDEW